MNVATKHSERRRRSAGDTDPAGQTWSVEASRSGRGWALDVDGLAGVFSQARRLGEAEMMAKDVIGLWFDVDPATISVELTVVVDDDSLAAEIDRLEELTHAVEAQQAEAAELRRRVVARLRAEELTNGEVAAVLGISHQRVSQLAS